MSYEFNAAENEITRKTGRRTKVWGMLTLGAGILTGLLGVSAALTGGSFGLVAGVVYVLLALIPFVVGRNFVQAGDALTAVVITEGNDIDHLMASMSGLGKAFIIQTAAAALWAALVLAGMALAIAAPSFAG